MYERRFSKARLVPVEALSSVVGSLDNVLPIGAVGYSSINAERQPLLGIDQKQYETFVSLVMQVIAREVMSRLSSFHTSVGFVFGATDSGVDRGVFEAAQSLNCPIVGVVAQKYLHYAVDEEVDIVFAPVDADYPKNYMALLTGGAVLPFGGAAHSFGQDLFRWLTQEGEVLMIINTLLELYTDQVSPLRYKDAVLNAPRAFASCCHLVGEEPFTKLPNALMIAANEALWKLGPAAELLRLNTAGVPEFSPGRFNLHTSRIGCLKR